MTGFEFIAVFFVSFLVALVVSSAVADAAKRKGRSWAAFFWLSLLVNWLIMAIIVAVITPIDSPNSSNRRPCPRCAELIASQASLCKHCGSDVVPLPATVNVAVAGPRKSLFITGVATAGIGLLWIVVYYLSAAQYPFGAATALNLENWNILLGLLTLIGGVVAVTTSYKKNRA